MKVPSVRWAGSPARDGSGVRLDWIEMDWVGLAGSGSRLPVNSRSRRGSLGRELQFFFSCVYENNPASMYILAKADSPCGTGLLLLWD